MASKLIMFKQRKGATDAGIGTRFFGNNTLVLIHTAYEYPAGFRSFFTEFDQVFRASLSADSARSTFIFDHFWQSLLQG